jgi:hypothetical protein
MRPGTGRRLDGDVWRQRLAALGQSLGDQAGPKVVVNLTAQRAQHLGGFGSVNGAAPAKADDHIGIERLEFIGDAEQIPARRIGSGAFDLARQWHTSFCQRIPDSLHKVVAAGERVAHQHRAFPQRGDHFAHARENIGLSYLKRPIMSAPWVTTPMRASSP